MSRQSEIHVSLQCIELGCAQSDHMLITISRGRECLFSMCDDALWVRSDVRRNQVMIRMQV